MNALSMKCATCDGSRQTPQVATFSELVHNAREKQDTFPARPFEVRLVRTRRAALRIVGLRVHGRFGGRRDVLGPGVFHDSLGASDLVRGFAVDGNEDAALQQAS